MYCSKCGAEILDEAVVCPKCGCLTNNHSISELNGSESANLKTIAKVLMIFSCVAMGLFIIPLAWTIPMTVYYSNCIKNNQHVSITFKICTLFFVNTIAGILMLCDNN